MSDFLPSNDDSAAWKAKLIDYYKHNAPAKVRMVNDAMMAKVRMLFLCGTVEARLGNVYPGSEDATTRRLFLR